MLPDIESLRCFVHAATQSSFRTAARKVALSPAAFGARIRRLEEQLGAGLFVRTTRRVVLTPQGKQLLPRARRCLDEAEYFATAFESNQPAPFELVLGVRFEVGNSWLVPALGALERARPERRLHVYFGDTPDLLPRVLHDEVHCMITSARISAPNLAFSRLHEMSYVAVATPRLAAAKPLASREAARSHVLLDLHAERPLFRYFLDGRSADGDWAFARVQYLGDIAAVRARVLEGAGVAVLPHFQVRRDIERKRLKVLVPTRKLTTDWLCMVWKRGHPSEVEIRALGGELARHPLP